MGCKHLHQDQVIRVIYSSVTCSFLVAMEHCYEPGGGIWKHLLQQFYVQHVFFCFFLSFKNTEIKFGNQHLKFLTQSHQCIVFPPSPSCHAGWWSARFCQIDQMKNIKRQNSKTTIKITQQIQTRSVLYSFSLSSPSHSFSFKHKCGLVSTNRQRAIRRFPTEQLHLFLFPRG